MGENSAVAFVFIALSLLPVEGKGPESAPSGVIEICTENKVPVFSGCGSTGPEVGPLPEVRISALLNGRLLSLGVTGQDGCASIELPKAEGFKTGDYLVVDAESYFAVAYPLLRLAAKQPRAMRFVLPPFVLRQWIGTPATPPGDLKVSVFHGDSCTNPSRLSEVEVRGVAHGGELVELGVTGGSGSTTISQSQLSDSLVALILSKEGFWDGAVPLRDLDIGEIGEIQMGLMPLSDD